MGFKATQIVFKHITTITSISSFSTLFQEHMLKFSACYEFVPGYYLIALD